MRPFRMHPSRPVLAAWLGGTGAVVDDPVTRHLDTCSRCAAVIEGMAGAGSPLITAMVERVLAPSAEFAARTAQVLEQRAAAVSLSDLLVDLYSSGIVTAALLGDPADGTADTVEPGDW